ncbi:MAG: acetylornithine/succinylornithine family transaminase [Candidatus Diapherotrites archaeon]|nr:acetylornithine/succinylornithine family transaminase [Candidatus Diapherotrites archaeon]
MNSLEVQTMAEKYLQPTYARSALTLSKGKGTYVWTPEGKQYLDLLAGIGTQILGHNPDWFEKKLVKQFSLVNSSNLYYSEPQAQLAKLLTTITGLDKCFFSNSGSEGIEVAIKLARKHSGKKEIIACKNAFHGRTMGALSATWNKKYKEFCKPLVQGFKHIPYNDSLALEKAITEKTAAFLVEPIQGEAGVILPSADYLKKVSKICREKNILLILDEVQTGIARTGKLFAFQHEKIKPDIVVAAKGLANGFPIGVTIAKKGIAFDIGNQGSTYGGNAFCTQASFLTLQYILQNKLMEQAVVKGNYFQTKLKTLQKKSNLIESVHGKGLMIGITFKDQAKKFKKICEDNGVLVGVCKEKTVRLLPPLTITYSEIDQAISVFGKSLQEIQDV